MYSLQCNKCFKTDSFIYMEEQKSQPCNCDGVMESYIIGKGFKYRTNITISNTSTEYKLKEIRKLK